MVCKIGFSIGVKEEQLSIKVDAHYCVYQFSCLNVEKKCMKNNGLMHIVPCLHFYGPQLFGKVTQVQYYQYQTLRKKKVKIVYKLQSDFLVAFSD